MFQMADEHSALTKRLYTIKLAGKVLVHVSSDDLLIDQEGFLDYYAEFGGFERKSLTLHFAGRTLLLKS